VGTFSALRVRVELADRPGALGALATELAHAGADIERITVLERRRRRATDDLLLQWPRFYGESHLVNVVEAGRATFVGCRVRRENGLDVPALQLVDQLLSRPDPLGVLVEHICEVIDADWCARIARGRPLQVVGHAGDVPADVSWQDVLQTAVQTPLLRAAQQIVTVPMGGLGVLCLGRHLGLPWHWAEVGQVATLAKATMQLQGRVMQAPPPVGIDS